LIVRLVNPVLATGTVIKTGDQVAGAVVVATEFGFNGAHVAVEVTPAASAWQK
jgi:hypothetical protein